MRARKSAAALQSERMNNPAQLPSYFRKLVREQMAAPALERLRQTAMGELAFKRPMVVNKTVQIVECEANEATQRQALVDLLAIAIPRQAGLVDDDGNSQTGVVILPAFRSASDCDVVEEEIIDGTLFPQREFEETAVPEEETVSPDLVALVLARRKNRTS